jgi:hypothetical protein
VPGNRYKFDRSSFLKLFGYTNMIKETELIRDWSHSERKA